MRIVFDYQCFHHQAVGGISRSFMFLAQGLARLGQQVTVFAGLTRVPRLREKLGPGVSVVGGFLCNARRRDRVERFNERWFALWSRLATADVYHPTYYRVLRGPRRARRVVTVWDFIHERFPDVAACDPGLLSIKAPAIEAADAAVCISQTTLDDLAVFVPRAQARARAVYLGCALEPRPATSRPGGYLLYVGTRSLYKNFAVLAAAYARFPELRSRFELVCVGGEPHFSEKLDGVRHVRVGVSDAELAALYAGATALVYPSRYEGFGLPVVEAMGCGCPVITTRSGSIPEVGGDAVLYFDPDSPEQLTHAVLGVADNPSLRARLITEGRQRAAHFTWDRCAEETLGVYQEVVGGRACPAVVSV